MKHSLTKSLDSLFKFLEKNREFNHTVQTKSYYRFLSSYSSTQEKVYSLLHHIVNTQSRPNINRLSDFFQKIYANQHLLTGFRNFVEFLTEKECEECNYELLFNAMLKQDGWGKKTSALFTKTIYHIHSGSYDQSLRIWNDAPQQIDSSKKFFLPVDTVIEAIFYKLDSSEKWNFDNINSVLQQSYSSEQMEIWDDLWFWGFITQFGSGLQREHIWNEQKYWALLETDKDKIVIEKIQSKSLEFLSILNFKQ